jgi:hypothetical protein
MATRDDSNDEHSKWTGGYVKVFELIEAINSLSNEIRILACEGDGVVSPVDTSRDAAVAGNVFCQVNAMGEQEHAPKLQFGI